jgi:trimethylamine--corrinoid protein Co-methyltransferase
MSDILNRKRRAGGRAANTAKRSQELFKQMPWRIPVNPDRPSEPLGPEGVAAIHNGAMTILEGIGIEFLNEEAIELFKQAGCTVNGTNVRMGRDWVMEMVRKAPAQFTVTPRNPNREIILGGKHILFGNVSSPPNYYDLELGKQVSGTRKQCADLLRLTQYFNCIHFAGGVWTAERAHRMFKDIMNDFEEPPMDVAVREELEAFVTRRKAEGGAPTDF